MAKLLIQGLGLLMSFYPDEFTTDDIVEVLICLLVHVCKCPFDSPNLKGYAAIYRSIL